MPQERGFENNSDEDRGNREEIEVKNDEYKGCGGPGLKTI
jgi:hypothetical protein